MTFRLTLGLVLALGSTLALNWAFVVQHGEAARLPPLALRRPIRSLRLLFGAPRWLLGFGTGIVGWALYVGALAFAPLSLVQAVSAGGIGLLALLVSRTTDAVLSRREWLGVATAVGGLALLGISLAGQRTGGDHASWQAVTAWVVTSVAVAAVAAGPGARVVAAGAGLGVAAGVLYAAGDVGTKAAVGGGSALLFVPVVLACHGLAFAGLQLGFQRGGALATAGVATLFTNALPILAGLVLYREPLPAGGLGIVRLAAFAVVVVGAAILARAGPVAPAKTHAARPYPDPSGRSRFQAASARIRQVARTIPGAPRGRRLRRRRTLGQGSKSQRSVGAHPALLQSAAQRSASLIGAAIRRRRP